MTFIPILSKPAWPLWYRVYGLCTWALQRDLVLFSNYQGLNLRLLDTLRLEVLFTFWFLSSKSSEYWSAFWRKMFWLRDVYFQTLNLNPIISLSDVHANWYPHHGTKEGWMEALTGVFDMLQYSKHLHIRTNGLRTPGWNLANKAPFL